jgi:outer membrane protein assembly factor BamB
MDPKDILLVGVKGTVTAFRRDTGAKLWSTRLKSGEFVTVAADDLLVYAHTNGELFCLDLQTGVQLWKNELPGLGYGIASLTLPGQLSSLAPIVEQKRHDAAAAAATHTTTSR